jgi:hypothetical protein
MGLAKDSRIELDRRAGFALGWLRFVLRLANFINAFLVRVDCSRFARNEERLDQALPSSARFHVPHRLQVNLEIALGGVSAKVKLLGRFFRTAKSALRRRMT